MALYSKVKSKNLKAVHETQHGTVMVFGKGKNAVVAIIPKVG